MSTKPLPTQEAEQRPEEHPPYKTIPLAEFERDYHLIDGRRHVRYRIVCTECGRIASETMGAQFRPPWVLVTFICASCGDAGQAFRARPCLKCGERRDQHREIPIRGGDPFYVCQSGDPAQFESFSLTELRRFRRRHNQQRDYDNTF